jgi:hypothetical protein
MKNTPSLSTRSSSKNGRSIVVVAAVQRRTPNHTLRAENCRLADQSATGASGGDLGHRLWPTGPIAARDQSLPLVTSRPVSPARTPRSCGSPGASLSEPVATQDPKSGCVDRTVHRCRHAAPRLTRSACAGSCSATLRTEAAGSCSQFQQVSSRPNS